MLAPPLDDGAPCSAVVFCEVEDRRTVSGLSLSFLHAALFDTGFLAGKATEIVQFGAAHLAKLVDGNRLDERRFHGEYTLNADTVGDFADSETLFVFVSVDADDYAAELLDTLFVTLFDAVSHCDGIAGAESGQILFRSGECLLHYFD